MLCRFTKSLAHRSLMAPVLVPTGRRLVETTAVDPAPPADKPRAAYNKPEISDTIFLKDLTFNAKHGVHAYEKNQAQPFVVSLELKVNSIKAGHTDNIDHTVDYSKVYTAVKDVMLSPTPKNLVEHLASSIVSTVFKQFPGVKKMTVEVRKPAVQLQDQDGPIGPLGVRVTRSRPNSTSDQRSSSSRTNARNSNSHNKIASKSDVEVK